jgi:hypothetical protein
MLQLKCTEKEKEIRNKERGERTLKIETELQRRIEREGNKVNE